MTIQDGGAKFNIGPTIDVGNQVRLGLGNVAARKLGTEATGYLSALGSGNSANLIDGNLEDAGEIVAAAIDKVTQLRGRIGAFQKFTVGATYSARSFCDYDCVWTFTVIARTARFITIIQEGETTPKRVGVRTWNGVESASPLGTYSMAPVLSANRAA